jgi:catechol 2,3-dioxygenase
MSDVSDSTSQIIRPTLHHFGVMTRHMEEMVNWYAKVLGMRPNFQSSTRSGQDASLPVTLVTNDRANHRIGLISWSGLRDDYQEKRTLSRLQHVAFEYETIDDLLNSYTRLKGLEIKLLIAVNHGPVTSFYYNDPDSNIVELFVDNFGNWDQSSEFMRSSQEFAAKPVDPEKVIAARKSGVPFEEIHRCAYDGEFLPSGSVDLSVMM